MKKSLILALVILVCCMSANAQYQTVKDIPYVSGGNQYAKERCIAAKLSWSLPISS